MLPAKPIIATSQRHAGRFPGLNGVAQQSSVPSQHRAEDAADEPFPGAAGVDLRRDDVLAEQVAPGVLKHVVELHDQHEEEQAAPRCCRRGRCHAPGRCGGRLRGWLAERLRLSDPRGFGWVAPAAVAVAGSAAGVAGGADPTVLAVGAC